MSQQTTIPSRAEVVEAAEAFFAGLASGDWQHPEVVLAAVADDASWWILGNKSLSGTFTKQEMGERFKGTGQRAASGFELTPTSWTVEGDRAAIEADGQLRLQDGSLYTNKYVFVLTVADGQVTSIREYWDTTALG